MEAKTKLEMKSMWERPAERLEVEKTIAALKANGFDAHYFEDEKKVVEKVFSIIPKGAEVMTNTSVTLDEMGISKRINESGDYVSLRNKLVAMDWETQKDEMRKLGTAPAYSIASVHAVTQDGKIMIASATGSQLPAAAYGAGTAIFVVGTQKIVKDLDEGMKRIYGHSLPLESERAKRVYGAPGSSVNKILIINKEIQPGRIHIIFVGKPIGF